MRFVSKSPLVVTVLTCTILFHHACGCGEPPEKQDAAAESLPISARPALEFRKPPDRIAQEKTAAIPEKDATQYIDDEKFLAAFTLRLGDMAARGKCLTGSEIRKQLRARKSCNLVLPPAETRALTPEEVYERASQGVYVLCSVVQRPNEPNEWSGGRTATAFAVTEDGAMVTNRHVFEDLKNERFGVANSKGEVFPVVEILAGSTETDIIVFRVAGKGFVPLPLARDEKVGAWVSVISHPGGQLYSFTQGYVTRYTQTHDNGKTERWMSITTDFGSGSSGAPALNKYGAVIGIATTTEVIDSGGRKDDDDDAPRRPATRGEERRAAAQAAAAVQMVVKTAVPSRVIMELVGKK